MADERIEIPDGPPDDTAPAEGPYRNLWVPLIVIPAGIVITVVLVFALFGSLSGHERSLAENLELVVRGGKNERDQALMNLSIQAAENHAALFEGREPPWPMEQGFPARVRAAVDEIDPDEHAPRLVLGILLATVGDEAGVPLLLEAAAAGDDEDPDRSLRFQAIQNLGLIGDGRATPAVIAFLDHEDEGLRTVAAWALSNLPGEGVRPALRGALEDPSLEVRGTAALSLARLDPPDPEAARVLRDLLDPQTYAAEHARDSGKYAQARLVSELRVRAVRALAHLGLEEDRARLQELADDPDVAVREAAVIALRGEGDPRTSQ